MIDEQRRIILALRESLLTPVDAMTVISHLLLDSDEGRAAGGTFLVDIEKVHSASTGLYGFVKEHMTPEGFPGEGDFDTRLRSVRHDIKNLLNPISGLCQIQLIEHPDGMIGRDLKRVIEFAAECVRIFSDEGEMGEVAAELSIERVPEAPVLRAKVEPASVLVADDNAMNRELLERFLERQGHSVSFACDGREALDLVEQEVFDLVLLDLVMPNGDGFEVLEGMRKSGKLGHTPVIILTGLDDVKDAVRCIEMGAEDFLSRPIELKLLKARVNACLEKKRLRERLYEQFFTPELAREIVRDPELLEREGRKAEVSVLFCDIRNFSTISERLGPSDTICWLRDVMGVLSDCIMDHGGVLVDYTGDEVMAMWGAPKYVPEHAALACRAATDMLAALPAIDARWKEKIDSSTSVGIGINTGEVYVGNVGTSQKFKYGPLGNTVNLASRVQGATKYFRSPILITGTTHERLTSDGGHLTRKVCLVKVNNINEPVELFELVPPDRGGWEELQVAYERALAEFLERDFSEASSILGNVLGKYPSDGPSLVLMSRAVDSMLTDGESFDPVWTLPGK